MKANAEGSILIEALMALAIFALAIVALVSIGTSGISRARDLADRMSAEAAARTMLARVGEQYPFAIGEWNGSEESGWMWRRSIKRAIEPGLPRSKSGRDMLQVEIEFWRKENSKAKIALKTLRVDFEAKVAKP